MTDSSDKANSKEESDKKGTMNEPFTPLLMLIYT